MRFLGLSLAQSVPDANSIWNFREALTRAKIDGKPAIEVLFKRFDAALTKAGFLAMGGQIIDATIVATPKQRNSEAEKKDIKEGRIPEDWTRKPAKLRQKDRDARWTVEIFKSQAVPRRRAEREVIARGALVRMGFDREGIASGFVEPRGPLVEGGLRSRREVALVGIEERRGRPTVWLNSSKLSGRPRRILAVSCAGGEQIIAPIV